MPVQDGLEQVDLEGREPVHRLQEAGLVDGKDDAQGLSHRGLDNVTTRQRIAYGHQMVDVAHIVAEEPAYAVEQGPVHFLATVHEPFVDIVDDLFLLEGAELKPLDEPVEMPPHVEDGLHRIDHRAAENIGTAGIRMAALIGEDLLEDFADFVSVLGVVDALELVQDQDEGDAPVPRDLVRETEHGTDVIVVDVPVQGDDLVGLGVTALVEDEMGAVQVLSDELGVFRRSRGYGTQGRGAEPGQEGGEGSDVHQVELPDGELPAGHAKVQQGLLDDGSLAGFRRFVHDDVLALGEKVAQDGTVFPAAEEVFPGDVTIVYERAVHGCETKLLRKYKDYPHT